MARSSQKAQQPTVSEAQINASLLQQTLISSTISPIADSGTDINAPITPVAEKKAILRTASPDDVTKGQPSDKFAVQQPLGLPPAEDAFAAYLTKKTVVDREAKKAAIAQKSQSGSAGLNPTHDAAPPTPWGHAPAGQIGGLRHDHFKVNVDGQGADQFQAYIQKKRQDPATNGKRYTATPLDPAAPVFSHQPLKSVQPSNSVQLLVVDTPHDRKQNRSPSSRFDPHSVSSPLECEPETSQNAALQIAKSSDPKTTTCSPTTNRQSVIHTPTQVDFQAPKPAVIHPLETSTHDGLAVHEKILQDLGLARQTGEDNVPLTEDTMLEGWGVAPAEYTSDMDDRISDDGVEECKHKENVRGIQGKDAAEELLNWDKTWLPPPCIWEDRGNFDTSFIPEYIRNDWLPSLAPGLVNFDLACDDFKSGRSAVNNVKLDGPVIHPNTLRGMSNDSLAYFSCKEVTLPYHD